MIFFCRMGKSIHTLDYETDHIEVMHDGNEGMTSEEIKEFQERVGRGEFIEPNKESEVEK